MKPRIIWLSVFKLWLCYSPESSVVGLHRTPSTACRLWWFGRRNFNGTGRRS